MLLTLFSRTKHLQIPSRECPLVSFYLQPYSDMVDPCSHPPLSAPGTVPGPGHLTLPIHPDTVLFQVRLPGCSLLSCPQVHKGMVPNYITLKSSGSGQRNPLHFTISTMIRLLVVRLLDLRYMYILRTLNWLRWFCTHLLVSITGGPSKPYLTERASAGYRDAN
jgi:hypothetical protein